MPADEAAGDRTEEATPRRRQRMRERGRVAKSRDLAAAVVLLGGMVMLRFGGETILGRLEATTARVIQQDMGSLLVPEDNEIVPHVYDWMIQTGIAVGPFLIGVLAIALAANLMQTGFLFSTHPLGPDLNKLNPVNGLKRIVSLKSLMTLAMNFGKLLIVAGVAYLTLQDELPAAQVLATLEPCAIVAHTAYAVVHFGLVLSLLFLILGLIDMAYQFYQHNQDIRMTRQEVKEEMKETEGDPQVRARRRQIQRQMAMQRMMQEVPEAEVVVRNPTHYAVAVQFKPDMAAPLVVAKGTDRVAMKIIEIALKNSVPVWQAPSLARQLYKIEIGDEIPPALFPALAEILSYVLKGEKLAQYRRALESAA